MRLLDAQSLEQIDAYAVDESLDPAFAFNSGALSVHEVKTDERRGVNLGYLSYYTAGARVISFGANGIKEMGVFIDKGGNDYWGVFDTAGQRSPADPRERQGLWPLRPGVHRP